jgi:hypothetical protein
MDGQPLPASSATVVTYVCQVVKYGQLMTLYAFYSEVLTIGVNGHHHMCGPCQTACASSYSARRPGPVLGRRISTLLRHALIGMPLRTPAALNSSSAAVRPVPARSVMPPSRHSPAPQACRTQTFPHAQPITQPQPHHPHPTPPRHRCYLRTASAAGVCQACKDPRFKNKNLRTAKSVPHHSASRMITPCCWQSPRRAWAPCIPPG